MHKPTLDAAKAEARTSSIYPPKYAAALAGRAKRNLGDFFGLTQIGVHFTTLPPGAWSSQRHWHETEDEFVFVVEGEVTLIDDTGEHVMTASMCAGFKAGVANGHHLVNKSAKPVTYLEFGTRAAEERAHYSEADMQAIKKDGKFAVLHKDGTPY